jgi:hypothetical protein
MIDFIKNNYTWLFSGLGITLGIFLWNIFFKNKDKKNQPNSNKQTNNNSIIINNNLGFASDNKLSSNESLEETSKSLTRILFIDDNHTDFKMVSILKKSGWVNTKSVKDITDLDDSRVLESDIIFVDINGVGTTLFQDQGLGLASALKKKYPQKKVVIYSSETKGDRFHKALREVDSCLHKDAEPYQFINLIEGFKKPK